MDPSLFFLNHPVFLTLTERTLKKCSEWQSIEVRKSMNFPYLRSSLFSATHGALHGQGPLTPAHPPTSAPKTNSKQRDYTLILPCGFLQISRFAFICPPGKEVKNTSPLPYQTGLNLGKSAPLPPPHYHHHSQHQH